MQNEHEILLYIAYSLVNQNQLITIDTLKQSIGFFQCEEFDFMEGIRELISGGFITADSNNIYTFTEMGEKEACEINRKRSREDFNRLIDCATDSTAYLDYCEELYGYRMFLFNMMDKAQLDYLFNSVPITESDNLLDLGCGAGNILNHLVKKYKCAGTGIDQLNKNIIKKSSGLINYINGNIDSLSDYKVLPNITLAIDSLYFTNDLNRLILTLRNIPDNRLFLYYSQYIFDDKTRDLTILQPDSTRLAQILRKYEITYQTIDYSKNEYTIYENALKILPKHRTDFASEGNTYLYENRIKDSMTGKDLYDKGLAARYLYII